MGYNLLTNGVYWGYNPLPNHLLTSWDILVEHFLSEKKPSFHPDDSRFTQMIEDDAMFVAKSSVIMADDQQL